MREDESSERKRKATGYIHSYYYSYYSTNTACIALPNSFFFFINTHSHYYKIVRRQIDVSILSHHHNITISCNQSVLQTLK